MSPPMMESPPGPETVIDGVRYFWFGGTSYLGLHGHPDVIAAGCRALQKYGVHTATSRSGFGTSPPLVETERLAAAFFGAEDAFWFSSGYASNHVVVASLAPEVTEVFLDAGAHYCLEEAALLAGRPVIRFRHRDPNDLASKLRAHLSRGGAPLVMADGVVAPTGRVAPVAALLDALSNYGPAFLHLDDAHGFGVLGESGRGTFEESGHWRHVNGGPSFGGVRLSVCGTLAKALGGYGGVVPGTRTFLDRVRSASHYFDGASAPAAPLGGCTSAALEICLANPGLRHSLRENIRRVRSGLRELGVSVTEEATANIGFVVGASEDMRRVHEGLKSDGILLPFVSSYSGLGAQGILRLAVCAGHSEEMISRLLTRLPLHLPT